ncbi:hypothetical protein [uncultured Maricaulis sp.]|mgnify:CR=1 FL=1|uniref:hypothetical protein n=1 Tax=uncultured Maricaulis sp. TaxID=174710 RepID=UPI0030DBD615|tara:strand:- start:45208 stop:45435 length:228 start_codon:yes stop_codon:yes gene_type:complete
MNDKLNHLLFESSGRELRNIKFSRGTGAEVSKEEFRGVVAKIIFEIENGIAETLPEFGDKNRKTVDVKEVIARLN